MLRLISDFHFELPKGASGKAAGMGTPPGCLSSASGSRRVCQFEAWYSREAATHRMRQEFCRTGDHGREGCGTCEGSRVAATNSSFPLSSAPGIHGSCGLGLRAHVVVSAGGRQRVVCIVDSLVSDAETRIRASTRTTPQRAREGDQSVA